jgi:acetyl-CoA carboxylase carboxyl transferase subunit beta
MSWFEKALPKIKEWVGAKSEVPDNLWHKCPIDGQMVFHRDLEANLWVFPQSGHHMRIPIGTRLKILFDGGAFTPIELHKVPVDPLKFRDMKRYSDRLKEAQGKIKQQNQQDAIIVAHGTVDGERVVVAAFDFDFMGGSMGVAVGEGIVAASKLAVVQQVPLIVIPASGGARMQESMLSLMQMPRTVAAVEEVKEAGLPYIVLLTDPTMGGVTASFAMLGDIQIAEPGASIGFAGKRVIEQTVRETLPDNFQTAEYLLEHGMIDMVVARKDMRDTLGRMIRLLMHPKPAGALVPATDIEPDADGAADLAIPAPVGDTASDLPAKTR